MTRLLADQWAERFGQKHDLKIRFEPDAAEAVVERSLAARRPVRDVCDELFKDYEFGLKLIGKNSGRDEFVLTRIAVENPERFISEMVVASYREHHNG